MNHADTYVECLHWLCFAEEISAYFQIHMIFLSWIWDGLSDTFNVSKVLNIYYLTIYHVFHTQNATRWLYLYAWLSHRRNNLILWVSLSQIECIWNMLKPLASWRTSCCVCMLATFASNLPWPLHSMPSWNSLSSIPWQRNWTMTSWHWLCHHILSIYIEHHRTIMNYLRNLKWLEMSINISIK